MKPEVQDTELASVAAEIMKYVHAAHHLSETVLQSNTTALENECGLSNAGVSVLQDGAALLHNATHFVNNAWIDTRHLLECSTFNPMYTTFVYDAICDEGVNGLTWLFRPPFPWRSSPCS